MSSLSQLTFKDILDKAKTLDRRTWIIISSVALVLVLFLVFVAFPAWILRFDVKRKAHDIGTNITSLENLVRRKPDLEKKKIDHLEFIKSSQEHLFKSQEMALLLGTISKMANETGVAIISSSPKENVQKFPPPFDARYEAGQYDFMVEGGYHQIGAFISRIESNSKLLRVEAFGLTPHSDTTKEGVEVATLTVSAVAGKEGKA